MTYPSFSAGEVLRAQDMNAVGLWLVKTQTVGSGVSSVTVTGAFSADYDNYRITYNSIATTVANAVDLKFNGSTGSTYNDAGWYITAGTATINIETGTSLSSIRIGITGVSSTMAGWFDVFSPNISGRTMVNGASMEPTYYSWRSGTDVNTASHTNFTLTARSGTMTGGTISVYGYKK